MDRLYRSRQDRMLAGVAGGLAELWDADPSLIRVIWALLVVFTGGIALVVYIVMAIVVPDEDELGPVGAAAMSEGGAPTATGAGTPGTAPAAPPTGQGWVAPGPDPRAARREARLARRAARGDSNFPAAAVAGGILIILGAFFLAREFLPEIDFDFVWPIALIGVGAVLVVSAMRRPGDPGS